MPGFRAGSARTRALLAVLAVVSLVAVFTTRVSRKMPDFDVYRTAGARAMAAEPLYRADDGHFQFKYLPAFAIFAAPLSMGPASAAKGAWFALSAILMLVLLGLSLRAMPEIHRPPAVLLVITFIAMAKFYAHELVLGQVNLLFAVLVVLAIVWMRSGRDAAAGLLLALAVVVKPYAAIFIPWLATRRNRTALSAMAAGLVMLLLLPAARYGWDGNLRLLGDWWVTVTSTTAPNLTNPDNVSLSAMFTRWLGPGSPAPVLATVAGAMLLGISAIAIAGRGKLPVPDTLEGSLLLLLIPLLSPQGWDYVFLIGTPAVMLLVNDLPSLPRGLRVAVIVALAVVAFSIFDVMGRTAYSLFMRMSLITVCVVIEIAALITLRFRRVA
jgi:arabinofuranan 3-O-arabinosyltransferase